MKTQQKTLGQRIKLLRNHYNLSRNQFGAHCKLSHVQVGKLEDDEVKTPQESTIEGICEAFGTTREFLLQGTGEMLPNGKLKLSETKGKKTDPSMDLLYRELKEEVEFYREILRNITGKPVNFTKPLNEAAIIPLPEKTARVIALGGKTRRRKLA